MVISHSAAAENTVPLLIYTELHVLEAFRHEFVIMRREKATGGFRMSWIET